MVGKRYVLECDWCGDIRLGDTINDLGKYYSLYRFKSVNPISDEIWLNEKPNHIGFKYLGFCCDDCAKEYFKENPEDIGHYVLIGHKNSNN